MSRPAAIAVVTVWVIATAPGVRADESAEAPEKVNAERPGALTTPLWRAPQRFDLHWKLLAIPETAVELLASPLALLIGVTEEYRLDRRVIDLLEFWDGKAQILPKVKLSIGDGLGLGASLELERLFSRQRANMELSATYRLDGDYKIDYLYYRSQPQIEGRQLSLYAVREVDGNSPYFGIGGDSAITDRRVLETVDSAATLALDLHRSGDHNFHGVGELGVLHQSLAPGFDAGRIPVGEPGDTVEPPPGFGDAVTYVQVAAGGDRDSRDTRGRPTRGTLIEFKLLGAFSVSGEDLAGLKLEAQTVYYLPVLPLARVLVLTGGATTTVKPLDDHEVPLHLFPALGRKRFLRGYERERFRDRHALWGNVEYRFPIYEYLATRVGLDAFLFFDGATAFGNDDLAPGNLRYSYGLGIRAAHDTRVLGGLTLGFSPEGFEINLGLGREL